MKTRFQIHLSTLLLATLVAAAILYMNMQPKLIFGKRIGEHYAPLYTGYGGPVMMSFTQGDSTEIVTPPDPFTKIEFKQVDGSGWPAYLTNGLVWLALVGASGWVWQSVLSRKSKAS